MPNTFITFILKQNQVGRQIKPSTIHKLDISVSGIFFAEPVLLDSDEDSDDEDEEDEDTNDAATVIFKQSPYSSPAPGKVL